MADDASAPAPSPSMTREQLPAEAELRMRDIVQRFGTLPKDKDELLGLLEDAETWLLRLIQEKTESMLETLSPIKDFLISRELLDHSDPDVKIAVTSCLTEVIRLTAPDTPYGDEIMKEVFQRIVGAFADLGDVNNPSYARRVSILDTVAGVRCCVLMLDLKLDHLILDMFNHFFKAASTNHSEDVIKWMELIMRVVIEESDDLHADLASCLLENLTKEAQVNLPASFNLAERLIGLHKDKPVFVHLFAANPLWDKCSSVVRFLFQDADNKLDASEMNMVGEGKMSTKSPQEISNLEKDVICLRQDDTHPYPGSSPTIDISNGGALGDNNKCPHAPASSEKKPEPSSGNDQAEMEQFISGAKEVSSDASLNKSQKLDSPIGSETNEPPKAVKLEESIVASEGLSRERGHSDNKKLTNSGKKAADSTPPATKTEGRPELQGKKSVRTKQRSGLKSGKVDPISDSRRRVTRQQAKEDAKSSSNKEMVPAIKMDKSEGPQEDNRVSKRKRLQEAEEAPPSMKNKLLGKNLVGSRIKVWWPDDKMFYNGIVESFNSSTKKHKVVYDDGDVEILLLKKEIWEFIEEGQDNDPDAASDIPHGRRGKGSSSLQMEGRKTAQSSSDSGNPPKKRGHPKGVRSSNYMSNADSPATSSAKMKGKSAQKDTQETPKPGRRITRSIGKANDDGVKDEAGGTKSVEESKDKAGSEDNNLYDKVKFSEAVDGPKSSTKRKLEKEEESSEEKAPAKASTGKSAEGRATTRCS